MNEVDNKIKEIEERIDKLNIGQFKQELMNQLYVNYRLQSLKKENYQKTGNTRIGGWPDLPKSIEYPTNENGYYNLILQLNFGEFKSNLGLLPRLGILYIFHGDENSDDFKVIYTTEFKNLEKKEPPVKLKNLNVEIDDRCYDGLKPSFKLEHYFENDVLWKIHKYDPTIYSQLTKTNSDYSTQILASTFDGTKDAYLAIKGFDTLMFQSIGIVPVLNEEEYKTQIDYLIRDCELKMEDATYNKSHFDRKKQQIIEFDKNRKMHLNEYRRTKCIISIESLRELNWQWGDMGEINLYIQTDDLLNKNFKNCHIEISSS